MNQAQYAPETPEEEVRRALATRLVKKMKTTELRDLVEYATNSTTANAPRSALIAQVIEHVLDVEVLIPGFED